MIAVQRSNVLLALVVPLVVGAVAMSCGYLMGKHKHRRYVSEDGTACHDSLEPASDLAQDVRIRGAAKRLDTIEERLDKHADRLRALEEARKARETR